MNFVMTTIKYSYNNNKPHNALYINSLPCERAICFLLLWLCAPARVMASSFTRFLDHTQRRTAFGRAPPTHRMLPNTHHSQQNKHPCLGGIRTRKPSKRPANWISRYSDIRLYLYKYSTELSYILQCLKLYSAHSYGFH